MDLSLTVEGFADDDATWLGSSHGTANGRSVTLDISAFTEATHYPDGYLPSGLPLTRLGSGLYGPYAAATGEDPAVVLAGFLLAPLALPRSSTSTSVVGALLDHGRVKIANLPVDGFEPPAPEADATTIVYIDA